MISVTLSVGGQGLVQTGYVFILLYLFIFFILPCKAFPSSASSSGLNSAFSFSMWKSSWFCVALVISVCFNLPSITFTWDSLWAACRPWRGQTTVSGHFICISFHFLVRVGSFWVNAWNRCYNLISCTYANELACHIADTWAVWLLYSSGNFYQLLIKKNYPSWILVK